MQNYNVFFFFTFFKRYAWYALFTLTFLLANTFAVTFEPVYLKRIIDGLSQNAAAEAIFTALAIYFSLKFAAILFEFLRDYIWAPVVVKLTRDVEQTVYEHLIKLPLAYHADQKSGSAVRAVVRGSTAMNIVLSFTVERIIPPLFELIFVTVLLLRLYTWQYGVITLGTIILYTWFIIWSNEKRIKYRLEGNVKDDEASGVLVDTVTNIETVKYFNNGFLLFKEWQKIKEQWISLITRNNRLFSMGYGAQSLIILAGLGSILYLAVSQAIAGVLSVGDLVLVSTYIVRLSGPISILGFVYGQYKNSIADLNAMAGILNQPITIPEPENPVAIKEPKGEVVFDNVTFAYEGREPVINKLSFRVEPGQKVAFVGSSGAGKSTLAKLLFRIFDVKSGEIRIDGVNVKDLSEASRRDVLGIVPQEPALFNDTIAANIRFAKPNATQAEIEAAAKAAQIHDFIMTLPEKYETKVGERGVKISGGQKQRVAIARSVIKDPKVLVFDEATSSLDSKSEQAILKTLDSVAKGRTTIAIAHRLSTIVKSDVIFVLQKGKIVEQGTHPELLKQNGVYAAMWELQAKAHHEEENSAEVSPEPAAAL